MKIKVTMNENVGYVSVDDKPSQNVQKDEVIVLEAKRKIIVSGNPLDPWRIVAWIDLDVPDELGFVGPAPATEKKCTACDGAGEDIETGRECYTCNGTGYERGFKHD